MRNTVIQPLAAKTTLTITIDPPMEEGERHFLLSPGQRDTVVVRVIDTGCISITNPTNTFVLIIFGITRIPLVSPELRAAIATLLQKVRP